MACILIAPPPPPPPPKKGLPLNCPTQQIGTWRRHCSQGRFDKIPIRIRKFGIPSQIPHYLQKIAKNSKFYKQKVKEFPIPNILLMVLVVQRPVSLLITLQVHVHSKISQTRNLFINLEICHFIFGNINLSASIRVLFSEVLS